MTVSLGMKMMGMMNFTRHDISDWSSDFEGIHQYFRSDLDTDGDIDVLGSTSGMRT